MRDGSYSYAVLVRTVSQDPLEAYVERAIELGYTDISFTEHAPLPERFIDPTPNQDCSMKLSQLERYLHAVAEVKARYRNDIAIRVGLEVDFIPGFEEETTRLLDEVGPLLDDSILSVHVFGPRRAICMP